MATHPSIPAWRIPWTEEPGGLLMEWVAIAFSSGSSQPSDRTQVFHVAADSLPSEPPGKPQYLAYVPKQS